MAIEIKYKLLGAGWATCKIVIDSTEVEVTASYLGDALCDLISAAITVLEKREIAVAHFWEEPGEYRFFLEPDDQILRVSILEFDDLLPEPSNEEGRVLLDAICEVRDFSMAVFETAAELLKEHGLHGYKKEWIDHPFPHEKLETLRELLSIETRH